MRRTTQREQASGECVLTVQLNQEEYVEDEEDVEFYLLFAGTTQRHLTTTLRVSHVTLQAVCPAHDRGETVQVTLCLARPGGSVDAVAEERFQYVQDLALDMAHFLLSASGQRDGLERALLLDECQIPLQECERLDETLALALRHIPLPPGWSVLGTDINTNSHTVFRPPYQPSISRCTAPFLHALHSDSWVEKTWPEHQEEVIPVITGSPALIGLAGEL
ncbi:hypothetical protein NFI96_000629 [Prochilodus magdalenae]|nr:hypothetical protein NFI96_000629 [Prochilodus magdalenae]